MRRNGFSLIEICLALLVVSTGILTVVGLVSSSLVSGRKLHNDLNAVTFAEMIFGYGPDALATLSDNGCLVLPDYSGRTVRLHCDGQTALFTNQVNGFTGTLVEPVLLTYRITLPETGVPNLQAIAIEVWPGRGTQPRSRTFYNEFYAGAAE